jgi:PAS domain-containing protein
MAGAATATARPMEGSARSLPRARQSRVAEHERQFREILEHCRAGLNIVDEEGRLLFHNARLRELMGYDAEEMHLLDTKRFWHDVDQRSRIIDTAWSRWAALQ